jgi:hypothetical protein
MVNSDNIKEIIKKLEQILEDLKAGKIKNQYVSNNKIAFEWQLIKQK